MVGSDANKISYPEVAFHYLDGGSVIGNQYQLSATFGLFKLAEFGFTGSLRTAGSSPITGLFYGDYETFHGKANIIPENLGGKKWVPAISAGFVMRFDVERVARSPFAANLGSPIAGIATHDQDFYIVATKTITQIKKLPIVLSGGYKWTNAQILGVAGNAPGSANTAFGAAAFVISGPAKSAFIFGAEAVQEPHYLEGLYTAPDTGPTIPTTLVYFVRVLPGKLPFNVDVGVGQFAGQIAPGINLEARHQVAMGVSYRF